MSEPHLRRAEPLVDLLDATSNADEVKALLRDAATMLGELLKHDVPAGPHE